MEKKERIVVEKINLLNIAYYLKSFSSTNGSCGLLLLQFFKFVILNFNFLSFFQVFSLSKVVKKNFEKIINDFSKHNNGPFKYDVTFLSCFHFKPCEFFLLPNIFHYENLNIFFYIKKYYKTLWKL